MKKIIYFILFILILTFNNNVFGSNIVQNTESNIKNAILVEDYISRHKNKIVLFIEKYKIFNNKIILKNIEELDKSIIALKKIQNINISKDVADKVLQTVLNKIKQTNISLKTQLKYEKDVYNSNLISKKNAFSKLGIKIANKINSINLIIAQKIFKNKKNLSEKELKIKQNLIKLNAESLKLKNFSNNKFESESEIKNSFIIILQNIKNEINAMKKTLK